MDIIHLDHQPATEISGPGALQPVGFDDDNNSVKVIIQALKSAGINAVLNPKRRDQVGYVLRKPQDMNEVTRFRRVRINPAGTAIVVSEKGLPDKTMVLAKTLCVGPGGLWKIA